MQLGRDFLRALNQLTRERNLSPELIATSLEAALMSAYKKYRGGNHDVVVNVDFEKDRVLVSEQRTVVKKIESEDTEITLADAKKEERYILVGKEGSEDTEVTQADAKKHNRKLSVGDVIRIEKNPEDFGRIAAQTARQVIIQRLKDAERQVIYEEFSGKIGEMITGIVFKSENDQIFIRLNERIEAILPREERISNEKYNPGDRMKFYVLDVRQTTRGPRIVVSRTHPGLLRKLLELEVPEIVDGIIEIVNIVREGGARAKVALKTLDANVDPVGSCVGNSGARIKAISRELSGEKVDVIIWSNDPLVYIRNSLSPAKVAKVEPVLDQERAVQVYVYPDQLSLAIGKAGQNVRLSARLTGWKIDINPMEVDRMPTLSDIFHDFVESGLGGKTE